MSNWTLPRLSSFGQKMAEIGWKWAELAEKSANFLANFSHFLPKWRQPRQVFGLTCTSIRAAQHTCSDWDSSLCSRWCSIQVHGKLWFIGWDALISPSLLTFCVLHIFRIVCHQTGSYSSVRRHDALKVARLIEIKLLLLETAAAPNDSRQQQEVPYMRRCRHA